MSHLFVVNQAPPLSDVLLGQVDGWKDRAQAAEEQRQLPLPCGITPAATSPGSLSPASPTLLTHRSPAQRLATGCSSRNRASGAVQGQRYL